jgi:hypothetical protein
VTDGTVPFFPTQVAPPPHPLKKALAIGFACLLLLLGLLLSSLLSIPFAGKLIAGLAVMLLVAVFAKRSRTESQLERAFRLNFQAELEDYREWSKGHAFTTCRLLQFEGLNLEEARDIPLARVERELEQFQWRGFNVDWAEHQGRLYLGAWQVGGPEPDWTKVFA